MKGLTKQDKDAIRDALMAYCENFPSRNRASESLQGVSAAVVSQILNTKYESISDDMFSRIAAQIGFSFEHWTICESENFRLATYVLADAQMYKNVTWMVGDAGCGKTTAAIEFRRTHRNVFYILCSEDMKRSDFVREIAKQVGAPTDSTSNLRDMLDYALGMIGFLQNPLLIFDEGDKLTDCVLNYFISIYNRLEGARYRVHEYRLYQAACGQRAEIQQERLQGNQQPHRTQVLRPERHQPQRRVCHLSGQRADR